MLSAYTDSGGDYRDAAVKYAVRIEETDEGFAVCVPSLPGCHSQGETEAEALTNIADAIREYLAVRRELNLPTDDHRG